MKKTAIILLTLLIAIAVNSCKKDYPKDIPDWLKDKIKQMKKENCYELNISIDEFKKYSENKTIYVFTKPCPQCTYTVYDYNGTILCNNIQIWPSSYSCGGIELSEYLHNRQIWVQECK